MEKEIVNAKITGASIGKEGHGIMTLWLQLDYGGSAQGFGGYDLRDNAALGNWINKLLEVVGVEDWNDLKSEMIRVEREAGWNGKILRIGNALQDKWFDPKCV